MTPDTNHPAEPGSAAVATPAGTAAAAPPAAAPAASTSTATAEVPLRRGGRVRLGRRTGTIRAVRRGPGSYIHDVRILFDGEEEPVYYPHSTLRTYQARGDMEVIDPGPPPGFLQRLLGAR